MLPEKKRVITVASNAELLNKHYYSRLWLATRNLKLPRRAWLDLIAETFVKDDIQIILPTGQLYQIPLVDEIFGNDPDVRWMSYFLRADDTDLHPASFSRKLERLRMIDLYFRIRYPDIAIHFSR
jgi:hypothetical protein